MKIIVDAMGGDLAPLAPVKGALMAHEKYGADIILAGRTEEILRALQQCGCKDLPAGVEIVNAEEVVEICDDPATAFKRKKDSSLTVGLTMLRDGRADGFVCAGSTGALLAGATLVVKRVRGLRRAALAPVIPTAKGRAVLIDCGANAECTVEYLLQFAYLGSYYAQKVLGVAAPRVALLNIGAEESKGDELRREAYQKLKEAGAAGYLNFTGNIEAKEAMLGECGAARHLKARDQGAWQRERAGLLQRGAPGDGGCAKRHHRRYRAEYRQDASRQGCVTRRNSG